MDRYWVYMSINLYEGKKGTVVSTMYREIVLPEIQLVELLKQVGRVHNTAYQPLEDNLQSPYV